MNVYFTAAPQNLVQQTINVLQSHGHTVIGQPQGPYTDVSLLRTSPQLGPQLLASAGAISSGWYVVVSQA